MCNSRIGISDLIHTVLRYKQRSAPVKLSDTKGTDPATQEVVLNKTLSPKISKASVPDSKLVQTSNLPGKSQCCLQIMSTGR